MFVVIFWLVLCFVIAAGASSRGRSGVGWFFISALVSPIIGTIILVCLPRVEKPADKISAPVIDENDEEIKRFIEWRKQQDIDKQKEV